MAASLVLTPRSPYSIQAEVIGLSSAYAYKRQAAWFIDGVIEDRIEIPIGDTSTEITFNGLDPDTRYYITVYIDAFRKYRIKRHSAEHDHRKRTSGSGCIDPPADSENHTEYKSINAKHQQRLGETPEQPQHRPAVSAGDIPYYQLHQQRPVVGNLPRQQCKISYE